MRSGLAGAAVAVAVVALLAILVRGGDGTTMSAGDAVRFTERALTRAGVAATVGEPEAGTFGDGSAAEDVWVVPAEVGTQPIALSVDADGDKALNLADGLGDGTNVLTDEQFEALARFRFDPRRADTAVPAVVALGAALAVGLALGRAVQVRSLALPSI